MRTEGNKQGILFLIILSLLFFTLPPDSPAAEESDKHLSEAARHLSEGRDHLDKGNYDAAISRLTSAHEKLPILGDYALLWRAKAYEDKGDTDKAISDLRAIKERFKDSPLIKNVRIKEIELTKKKSGVRSLESDKIRRLFEEFLKDYPSELNIKYAYALFFKENNETEKAKKIFKEIFISVSPFSKNALHELSPSDITADDLLKKGGNLNKAWLFGEAEKSLRDALQKSQESRVKGQESGTRSLESGEEKISTHTSGLKTQILEKLAYSIFRQKRYKEAADLYKTINNRFWRARSVLRTGDIKTFESELSELLKTGDKRVASMLIAYGTMKRRDGDIEGALETFSNTLSRYPSEKEDILWAKGWTYYLSGDCKNASAIFSGLHNIYGRSKYLYWKNKCMEKTGTVVMKASPQKKNIPHRDYYGFLTMLKNSNGSPTTSNESVQFKIQDNPSSAIRYHSLSFERVDILAGIGMKQEAVSELIFLSRKNQDPNRLIHISSYLKNLGSYKRAVNLIVRVPYNEELHELFYPSAFKAEVEVASRENGIDPLLILSVMREESRFDAEARSIAGALGLMQLMPHTAQKFDKHVKVSLKNSSQLYDARTNILIGSYYLQHLLKTYNSIPVAIAAYNAGEGAVNKWLKKNSYDTIDEFIEDIPYNETRNYVKRVLTTYFEYIRANRDIDISSVKKHIGNL